MAKNSGPKPPSISKRSRNGKRQIARLTKKQLGSQFAQNVLARISELAGGVRDLVFKGQAQDGRTGQKITVSCSPDDIQRGFSTEQIVAIEDLVSVWATTEEPTEKPKGNGPA